MKDIAESRERLSGLFNITVTPFTKEGNFDFTALEENIERMLGLGYDGLLIGGTYGEFPTMDSAERAELFRQVMKVVGDRVPVMLCSASSDPRTTIELTKLAGELGGIPMVTAPYVSEITDVQIVEFFKFVAPLSKTGILIYNAPGIGITLNVETIKQISEISQVVALKQGDLNPTTIDCLANELKGKLKLFCASDLVFPGPIAAGFDGVSSTNSCALPEVILATYRALKQGDSNKAIELHQSWYEMRKFARKYGQPQSTKAAMRIRGFKGGYVRKPLLEISESAEEELKIILNNIL